MSYLNQAKVLLGIKDGLQDEVLKVIQDITEQHFLSYVGETYVPNELEWLIVEVMVKRYNRLGSEGLSSQSAEGISMTFGMDDFAPYSDILKRIFRKSRNVGVKFI